MPSKDTKILKFNLYKKSDKAAFTFYADLECIMEKIYGCKNNCGNKQGNKHITSDFSTSTISSFRSIENKHSIYRGKIA